MKEKTRNRLTEIIGDRTDDEAIEILELINDDGIDDGVDWEKKYKENDAEWRQRYTKRFLDGTPKPEPDTDSDTETDEDNKLESLTIESVLYE